ncbi:Asd/ArgC dimerization domain-containing protein [Thermodesulfovibrio sp. 3462-1]|uniref:Asd/ArgC dimerization domain-containing protein n=1 Tax=Thermodesulfovibrio obliviosus TaxID=3118332 RepID=A0AAU8H545_9BACT
MCKCRNREKIVGRRGNRDSKKGTWVIVLDDPQQKLYPLQIEVAGRDEVFVGRIREDFSIENGLNLWIVADNLRKGAATNAVQIAEVLIEKYL